MNTNQINIDNIIKAVVDECRTENGIINDVIRDDVFKILEKHCYVVYYPLEKEDINGFHVMRTVNGEKKHFVYINTWNTTERQIFAAAHELGHIWDVYGKVKSKFLGIDEFAEGLGYDSAEEFVVNKFAAQLLMPEDLFKNEIEIRLKKLNYNGQSISLINLLRLTIGLMDTFFVGYKATTKRFFEIGRISEDVYNILKEYEKHPNFEPTFKMILKEGDYKRLNNRPESKNISNLAELIRKAETGECHLENTLNSLKNKFEISPVDLSKHDDQVAF